MNLAKYIVLTKNKKEVRFFAIGEINEDGTFTGIMHDYTGGGNYEERLIYQDKWIPEADSNNEPLEWDEEVEIFDILSPNLTVQKIEDVMDNIVWYDTEAFNYIPRMEAKELFNENGVLIDNMSLRVPYGLGNTSFVDGYEILESIEYKIITDEDVYEERVNRTLHKLDNGMAYYNYEGVHFRVFKSFEDGMKWIDSRNDNLVIAEFDDGQELDKFIGVA